MNEASPSEAERKLHTEAINRYWRINLAVMSALLLVWAAVGLGAGVLFADILNAYAPFGIPLGFWFAQQGSIATFVVIILVYAVVMNRLDRRFHEQLDKAKQQQKDQGEA